MRPKENKIILYFFTLDVDTSLSEFGTTIECNKQHDGVIFIFNQLVGGNIENDY